MKAALRKALLARRAALAPEDRRRAERAVAARLAEFPPARAAGTLAGYWSLPVELDLSEFLAAAARGGKRVLLPRVDGDGLDFYEWRPGDALERSALGVREPLRSSPRVPSSKVDLMLVPGVGFDRHGHRLGLGRGYYDRALARVPRAARVGVAFDVQVVDALPTSLHDQPLGWLVTPGGILHFQHGVAFTGSENR